MDGDPSALVVAGAARCDPTQTPSSLRIHPNGYDGQYYYAMALSPWVWQSTMHGITLDIPSYRLQRVLYPLLAWAAAAGDQERVPVALIAVNVAATAAVAGCAALLLQQMGIHALPGVVIGLTPTFAMTLGRDLTELVELAFLLAGWLAVARRQSWRSGVFMALALLARDTAVFAAGGLFVAWAIERMRRHDTPLVRWPSWAVPLGTFALWQAILTAHWGQLPFLAGISSAGRPGLGLLTFLGQLRHRSDGEALRWRIELAILLLLLVTAAVTLWQRRGQTSAPAVRAVSVTWLCYLAFPLIWSQRVWSEDWAFLRALTELWIVSLGVVVARNDRWTWPVAVASLSLWAELVRRLMAGV